MSDFDFVFNTQRGLGDCLSCFNTNRPIWSPSPHFEVLRRYTSLPSLDQPQGRGLSVSDLHRVDFRRQHLFNRVRLVSGMPALAAPRAILDRVDHRPIDNNIAFSFDVGPNAPQKATLHPRARELYAEHRVTVQDFIRRHADRWNFIEVGMQSFGFDDTLVQTGVGLERTIQLLRRCRYYFGMHSGMMHLATAIGLQCLILINMPSPERVVLTPGGPDEDTANPACWETQWLYPQHTHLHEDATHGPLQPTAAHFDDWLLARSRQAPEPSKELQHA